MPLTRASTLPAAVVTCAYRLPLIIHQRVDTLFLDTRIKLLLVFGHAGPSSLQDAAPRFLHDRSYFTVRSISHSQGLPCGHHAQ